MSANKTNRGLGKGLSALLGEIPGADQLRSPVGYVNKEIVGTREQQGSADILRIPAGMIEPNPFQPRQSFDPDALDELAESIRTFGLIQPITVRRKSSGGYQIISGERRFRACRLAGMDMVPAYVVTANDQGMLEMAIVENIQREELDPIELAMSYQRLIEECRLTQERLAERVGKKRASVANQLRLLKLPVKVQHDLKVGLLSVGHAKVLLSLDDAAAQEALCDQVVRSGMSVRQLEEKVKTLLEGGQSAPPAKARDLPEEYYRILEHFGKYFGDNISLRRSSSGKGSITIRFSSDEEVRRFLDSLGDSTRQM